MNAIDYVHIYEPLKTVPQKLTTGSLEKMGFPTASNGNKLPGTSGVSPILAFPREAWC